MNVLRSLISSGIRSFAMMFEFAPHVVDIDRGITMLRDRGFTEFYLFGRIGISPTYIGEYRGAEHLQRLYNGGVIKAGNVVAF